jgi:hypothetical protein
VAAHKAVRSKRPNTPEKSTWAHVSGYFHIADSALGSVKLRYRTRVFCRHRHKAVQPPVSAPAQQWLHRMSSIHKLLLHYHPDPDARRPNNWLLQAHTNCKEMNRVSASTHLTNKQQPVAVNLFVQVCLLVVVAHRSRPHVFMQIFGDLILL